MKRYILTLMMILASIFFMKNQANACPNQLPIPVISNQYTQYVGLYISGYTIYGGKTAYFDGSNSYDPDYQGAGNGIVEWKWKIHKWNGSSYPDTGVYFTGQYPEYSFTEPGIYLIKLWVQDTNLAWSSYGASCYVHVFYTAISSDSEYNGYGSDKDFTYDILPDILHWTPDETNFRIMSGGVTGTTKFHEQLSNPAVSNPAAVYNWDGTDYNTGLPLEPGTYLALIEAGKMNYFSPQWALIYGEYYWGFFSTGEVGYMPLYQVKVDLDTDIDGDSDIDNDDDPGEENPGSYISVGGDRKLISLNVELLYFQQGYVLLSIKEEDRNKAEIYSSSTGGLHDDYIIWNLADYDDCQELLYFIINGLFIQGTEVSTALMDIQVGLFYFEPSDVYFENPISFDIVNFTAYQVTDVQWVKYGDNLDLDTCPKNGGKRIFPDLITYDDEANYRNKVYVEATITPQIENLDVYFSWWDVDDPSSDASPIDENGSTGGDNFGTGASLSTTSDKTDSNGKAKVVFNVTMRPGDNFRIAAACAANQVKDSSIPPYDGLMTQAIADGTYPITPAGLKLSLMLTVWRLLNIEFDTMGNPPSTEPFNTITGTSLKITNTQLFSQVNPAPPAPGWVTNKLEGGVLDPESSTNVPISVDYVNHNTFEVSANDNDDVTVLVDYTNDDFDNDSPPNGIDDGGEIYTMNNYAADPSNAPFGINTDDYKWGYAGEGGLTPPSTATVLSGMNIYYKPAYILVREQPSGNSHPSFPFVRMAMESDIHSIIVDVSGDSSYWCTTAGWAYESELKKDVYPCPDNCTDHDFYGGDDDPENEGVTPGYIGSIYGRGVLSGEKCVSYLEILRDRGNLSIVENVSHEVGHTLGLQHSTYVGSFDADEDGIMGWDNPNLTCMKDWMDLVWAHSYPNRFSNQNIADLRKYADD